MIPDSYDLCPVRRERSTSLVASGGRQRSRRRGNQGGREGNGHPPDATARQNGSAAVSRSVSGRAPRSELPVEVRGDEENAAERDRIRSNRAQKLGRGTGGLFGRRPCSSDSARRRASAPRTSSCRRRRGTALRCRSEE